MKILHRNRNEVEDIESCTLGRVMSTKRGTWRVEIGGTSGEPSTYVRAGLDRGGVVCQC